MMDRRQSPRIKFAKNKSDFFVKLHLKRFFFKDRELLCRLRDISEGGASLLIDDEFKKYVSENNVGARAQLISESSELSFRLMRKGRVMRVINEHGQMTVVVLFKKQPV
jgi:hypothetical protein